MREKNESFVKKGFAVLAVKIAGAASTFGVFIYIGNTFGAEGAGVYATMFAVTILLAMFCRCGADGYLLKNASIAFKVLDIPRVKYELISVIYFSVPFSIVICSILVTFAGTSADLLGINGGIEEFAVYIASVPFVVIYGLIYTTLQAEQRNIEAMALMTMLPQLFVLVFLLVLKNYSNSALPLAYLLSSITCVAIGVYWIRKILAAATESITKPPKPPKRAWNAFLSSKTYLAGGMLQQLSIYFETIAISVLIGSYSAGIYSAALRLATIVYFVFVSINGIAAPRIAAADTSTKQGQESVRKITAKSSLIMTLFALPVTSALIAFPEFFLRLFGEGFEAGTVALQVLAIGQFVYCLAGPAASTLIMSGNQRYYRNIMFGVVAIQILGGIVLIHQQGVPGAAVSYAFCALMQNALFILIIRRHLGFTGGVLACLDVSKRN